MDDHDDWNKGQKYLNRRERLNSTPLKQKAGKFVSVGVSQWKSPGEY